MALSDREKEAVKLRAGYRCEYCRIVGWEPQVDHVIPRSPRLRVETRVPADPDAPTNLAAACAHCNRLKGNATNGRDPLTGRAARLFNPRRNAWDDHFAWSTDFERLLPLSEIGGATIARLRMNDPLLRRQRRLLRQAMSGGAGSWP